MKIFNLFLSVVLLGSLSACGRDPIESFKVPKETQPPAAMPAGMLDPGGMPGAGAESHREISWDVPKGWHEQAPSSMRVGSFLIPGENGQSADVSIIPLSGEAGGDAANINRWRGQINLPPISEEDLSSEIKTVTLGGRRMRLVELVGRKRILAAILVRGERTWFFKMTGDDAVVRAAKPAFMDFLSSLRFQES